MNGSVPAKNENRISFIGVGWTADQPFCDGAILEWSYVFGGGAQAEDGGSAHFRPREYQT